MQAPRSAAEESDTAARKAALRSHARARRADLSVVARRRANDAIRAHLRELDLLAEARHVLVYLAHGNEVDLDGTIDDLRARGARTYAPREGPEGIEGLEVVALDGTTTIVRGRRGIREPGGPAVAPSQLDAVVVPGVAFDPTGGRIGQGAGHYDRLLPHITGPRIAVAFSCQMVDATPREEHDATVDVIVTEDGVLRVAAP